MTYDINDALERLEKNLQDLDSARTQVEKTVAASLELQRLVSDYVSSVKTLGDGLQSWDLKLNAHDENLSKEYETAISRVNSSFAEIINTFKTDAEKISSDFKSKTDGSINKLTEQNNILSERVRDLNSVRDEIRKATNEIQVVKESLTQISKDLKDSQDNQDAVLNSLNQKSDQLISKVNGIEDKVNTLLNKADSNNTLLTQVKTLGQGIKTTTDEIHTKLQSTFESLSNAITESNKDTSKSININRWIMIVAFIILLILYFI